jgi:hypothetical protein
MSPTATPRHRRAARAARAARTTAAIAALAGTAAAAADRPVQTLSDAFHTASLAPADFDGDGRIDVAAAGYDGHTVSWFRQTAEGWERHDVHTLPGAFALLSVDIDGDGDLDLVASSRTQHTVYWFENRLENAAGGPPAFIPRLVLAADGGEPSSLHAGDVDGDGTTDLLVAFTYRPEIVVLTNPGGSGQALGQFISTIPVPGNGVSWIAGDDVDGDGDLDIVAATPWDWVDHVNYYWFANDGAAGFGPRIPIAGGEHLHGAFAAAIADLDGDGRRDLVTMSDWGQGNRTVNWFRRLDDAGTDWSDANVVDADFHGSDGPQSLTTADLDGDGRPDIVAGSSFLGPGLRVWWNRGPGAGSPAIFHAENLAPGFPAHGVTTADLDGDGGLEVVAGSWAFENGRIRAWTILDADCPGDVDGDGTVGPADMAALLAAWGPCPGEDCPADLDDDGHVSIADLITLLAVWGPC